MDQENVGKISNFLGKYKKISKEEAKKKPNSERAEQIEALMVLMGEKDPKRFKYWLGRTKKFSPRMIFLLMEEARKGVNPPALFNYLLKTQLKIQDDKSYSIHARKM